MSTTVQQGRASRLGRQMLNKVPEVTLYFWVIKIMCTTVGETAADYLNVNLGFGLSNTSYVMAALLAVVLVFQFRARRYVPGIYWLAVVFISVVGTLITDNMTDGHNVPLTTSTILFSILLALTFGAWYLAERTLSIHTIFTTRREAFYWLAILFTFALGTAAGDLMAERLDLGYGVSIGIFGAAIALVAFAHYALKLGAVVSFWLAYILTRPLGASIGDFMSQHDKKYGGLGLGTTGTSYIFLGCILTLVVFLTRTRRDVTEVQRPHARREAVPDAA
ncbi:MAG: COG4705 family protein [Solirubrobacteraceae bacterium]